MEKILARSTEAGSRQLVWAAVGGADHIDDLRGAYVSLAAVNEPSDYVISKEGFRAQTKLWVCSRFSRLRALADAPPAVSGLSSRRVN